MWVEQWPKFQMFLLDSVNFTELSHLQVGPQPLQKAGAGLREVGDSDYSWIFLYSSEFHDEFLWKKKSLLLKHMRLIFTLSENFYKIRLEALTLDL